MKLKIKRGDTVQVIAGADKGKKGSVLDINLSALKVKVQSVNMKTHFSKKDGILKKEGFIDYSNVKLIEKATDKKTKKTTKTKKSTAEKVS